MSLIAIVTSIIIVAGIGVGVYFLFIKKKTSTTSPPNTDKPTSLQITASQPQTKQ